MKTNKLSVNIPLSAICICFYLVPQLVLGAGQGNNSKKKPEKQTQTTKLVEVKGIPQEIMIHTFDSSNVERKDFHKYTNWYEEIGNVQTFKLHPGDCNTRNSRKYCRIEAHTVLKWKRGEVHEFTGTYNIVSCEQVAIFQVFNTSIIHPQLYVKASPNGDISYQSRGNPGGHIASGYLNKDFTLHVKDDGIKWQLYFNNEKVAEGEHQEKGPETTCAFRWGLYDNYIPAKEMLSTVRNVTIK